MKYSLSMRIVTALLPILILCSTAFSQKAYRTTNMDLTLKGTSNIHNWEMKAVKCNSNIEMTVNAEQKVTSISGLTFDLQAKSLKSEWKVMDNNTYKALRTAENPDMKFTYKSAVISSLGNNTYEITCQGTLTIAGVSKETQLVAKGIYNPADKSFSVTGIKKLKMSDFDVKAPKALLGTIKTGDDISVNYNIKFI